jgi:hypothetical protein
MLSLGGRSECGHPCPTQHPFPASKESNTA